MLMSALHIRARDSLPLIKMSGDEPSIFHRAEEDRLRRRGVDIPDEPLIGVRGRICAVKGHAHSPTDACHSGAAGRFVALGQIKQPMYCWPRARRRIRPAVS